MKKETILQIIAAVGIIVVAGISVFQSYRMNSLGRMVEALRAEQQGSMPRETESPKTNEMGGVATEMATRPTMSGREPFGPLVSPDGMWVLHHEVEQRQTVDGTTYVHNLSRESLVGQGSEDILTVTERHQPSFEPYPNERFTSSWELAGWSADGASVYFLSSDETDGLGGDYPITLTGGSVLHKVDVATGEEQILLNLGRSAIIQGVKDVYAEKRLVLFTDQKGDLVISDLNGNQRRVLRAGDILDDDRPSIGAAIFSPDAHQVALVTYLSKEVPDNMGSRTYAVEIMDTETGITVMQPKDISAFPDFRNWQDGNTIRLGRFMDNETEIISVR